MRPHYSRLELILVGVSVVLASCALPESRRDAGNGIFVDVKVFNNRDLQTKLQGLSNRLGQISGIDQNSLTSRLGSIQGVTSSQFAMNLQASGLAAPSTTTTSLNSTPSVAQTAGGTTSTFTPQTVTTTVSNATGTTNQSVTTTPSNTVGTSNQTVTTTPSNTVQTVTSMPVVTPTIPTLPTMNSLATPTSPMVSALDTLGEQMQLSYQIINLQLLLQGALSDEYTEKGTGKRHVTFGFPISVLTPPEYEGAVAEVEVSVCNPANMSDETPPTIQTIIPQEKTYNVASIVGSSVGL